MLWKLFKCSASLFEIPEESTLLNLLHNGLHLMEIDLSCKRWAREFKL